MFVCQTNYCDFVTWSLLLCFQEKRKVYHMRNIKKNKFEELKGQQAQQQNASFASPSSSSRLSGYPSRVAPPPPGSAANSPAYGGASGNLPYSVTSPSAATNLPYPVNPGSGIMPMGPPSYRWIQHFLPLILLRCSSETTGLIISVPNCGAIVCH